MAVDLARRTTITSFSTAKTVNLKAPFTIGSPLNSTHEIFINLGWIFAWKMEFFPPNLGNIDAFQKICRIYWKRSCVKIEAPQMEAGREKNETQFKTSNVYISKTEKRQIYVVPASKRPCILCKDNPTTKQEVLEFPIQKDPR